MSVRIPQSSRNRQKPQRRGKGHPESGIRHGAGGNAKDQGASQPQRGQRIGRRRAQPRQVHEPQHHGGAGRGRRESQQRKVAGGGKRQQHGAHPARQAQKTEQQRQHTEQQCQMQSADSQQMRHPGAGKIPAQSRGQGGPVTQQERGRQSQSVRTHRRLQPCRQTPPQIAEPDREQIGALRRNRAVVLPAGQKPQRVAVAPEGNRRLPGGILRRDCLRAQENLIARLKIRGVGAEQVGAGGAQGTPDRFPLHRAQDQTVAGDLTASAQPFGDHGAHLPHRSIRRVRQVGGILPGTVRRRDAGVCRKSGEGIRRDLPGKVRAAVEERQPGAQQGKPDSACAAGCDPPEETQEQADGQHTCGKPGADRAGRKHPVPVKAGKHTAESRRQHPDGAQTEQRAVVPDAHSRCLLSGSGVPVPLSARRWCRFRRPRRHGLEVFVQVTGNHAVVQPPHAVGRLTVQALKAGVGGQNVHLPRVQRREHPAELTVQRLDLVPFPHALAVGRIAQHRPAPVQPPDLPRVRLKDIQVLFHPRTQGVLVDRIQNLLVNVRGIRLKAAVGAHRRARRLPRVLP